MSDIGGDYQATMEMIPEALGRLQKKYPKHVLIQFWLRIDRKKVYANFKRRFGRPNMSQNVMDVTHMYSNFLVAILAELGELKHDTPRKPSDRFTAIDETRLPPSGRHFQWPPVIDGRDEDHIPF